MSNYIPNRIGREPEIQRLETEQTNLTDQFQRYTTDRAAKETEAEFASMDVMSLIEDNDINNEDDIQIQELETEADTAQEAVSEAEQNEETAQDSVNTADETVGNAETNLVSAQECLNSAQAALSSAQGMPATIEVDGEQKPNPDRAAAIADAQAQVADAQAQVNAAKEELEAAKNELENARNELTNAQNEVTNAQAEYEEAQANLEEARNEEDQQPEQNDEDKAELQKKCDELEQQISNIDEQITEIQTQIDNIERQISELQTEDNSVDETTKEEDSTGDNDSEGERGNNSEQFEAQNPLSNDELTAEALMNSEGQYPDEEIKKKELEYAEKLEQQIQSAIDDNNEDAIKFLKGESETLTEYTGDNETLKACRELINTALEAAEDSKNLAAEQEKNAARLKAAQENEDVSKQKVEDGTLYHYDANGNILYSESVSTEIAPQDLSNDVFSGITSINGDTLDLNEYCKNKAMSTDAKAADEKYIEDVAKSITNQLAEKFGIDATVANGNYTAEMESVYRQIYENNKDLFVQSGYDNPDVDGNPIKYISEALASMSWDGDPHGSNDSINLAGITPEKSPVILYNEDGLPIQGTGQVTQRHTPEELQELKNKVFESIGVYKIGEIPPALIEQTADRYYDQMGLDGVMSRDVFRQAFEGYNTQMKYQNAALDCLNGLDLSNPEVTKILSPETPKPTKQNGTVQEQNYEESGPIWDYYKNNKLDEQGIDYQNFVLSCVAYSHVNSGGTELRNGVTRANGNDNDQPAELGRYFGIFDTDRKQYTLIDFGSNPPTYKEPIDMVLGSGTNDPNRGATTLAGANFKDSYSTLSGFELISYSYNGSDKDKKTRYNRYVFGLEKGKNDQAYAKWTVVHPTGYNSSQGCPAYKMPNYTQHRGTAENMEFINTYFPRGTIMYTTPPQSVRDEYEASTDMINFRRYRV